MDTKRLMAWRTIPRRKILRGAVLAGSAATLGPWLWRVGTAWAAETKPYQPVVADDGMLTQPWFTESFLDLKDDLAEANAKSKRLAVIWEQRGCPYCREMHMVNFADPEITDYIRSHFLVLQMNIYGSRPVTDFDGKALEEKAMARNYGVVFTPTIQFFPDDPAAVIGKPGNTVEIARMPGYFKPFHFLSMFQYVFEKAYEKQDFQGYVKARAEKLRAEGKDVKLW